MELVKITGENFRWFVPLIEAMYIEMDKADVAIAGVERMEKDVEHPDCLMYAVCTTGGAPVAMFYARAQTDVYGMYLFLENIYSKDPRVTTHLVTLVEKVAAMLGCNRVKAVCVNPRAANALKRRKYNLTGAVLELPVTPDVQKLNESGEDHG